MARFNTLKFADHWAKTSWNRLRSDIDYERFAGPDDVASEGTGVKQGRTFPHPMNGGEKTIGPKFYDAVYTSPFGNELTWAAAQTVIENEHLGEDDATDFLTISYSSNDAIGHSWGPDSQEVLDVTLRSDLIMADMIRYLDEKIGRDNYLLVLSADHGVCPLPEVAFAHSLPGKRVDGSQVTAEIEKLLTQRFGKNGKWIEALTGSGYYLRAAALRSAGKTRTEVEEVIATWLRQQPFVEAVYTRTQLLSEAALDALGRSVRASFHPARSGDVIPIIKPYHIFSKYLTGTTHGSPHGYDTHVPLVVFGADVVPGKHDERISPQAAAVILAQSIGQRLQQSLVEAPEELFASHQQLPSPWREKSAITLTGSSAKPAQHNAIRPSNDP
jgi:hypothetical protein